jgi:hypothetical protein
LEKALEEKGEEQQALELDKLEVTAKAPKAEEPVVSASAESQEKPTASRSNQAPPWQRLVALIKGRAFVLSVVAGIVAVLVLMFFIPSPPTPTQPDMADDVIGKVVYVISSPIGLGNYVDIRLSVPFKDADEKRDLMKKLAKVKHELPRATRGQHVTESIKNRDLDALREHLVTIVSTVTGMPAEKLGVEIQSLE